MANQHHPPESGKRPYPDVLEPAPTCHLCSWAFAVQKGLFLLKILNSNCALHRSSPGRPEPLAEWLGVA